MGSWEDTSKLFFFLYKPEHTLDRFTNPGTAFTEETLQALRFDNRHFTKVQIGKGIGDILLHREMPNWKTGDEFATAWETRNVAEEGYNGLCFTIVKRTPDIEARMLAWNKEHPDDLYTDHLAIDHGTELAVWLYLTTDMFHDLVNLNWQEKYLEVSLETSPSIHNLKFPLKESDKAEMREGRFCNDFGQPLSHRKLVIRSYEILVRDVPLVQSQERHSLLKAIFKLLSLGLRR